MQSSNNSNQRGSVVSRERWNEIKQLAEGGDSKKKNEMAAKKLQFGDYLKNANVKMTKNWRETKEKDKENNIGHIIEQKKENHKKEIKKQFDDIIQRNEKKRKMRIEEATMKSQMEKMGARQLQSAALLSEVLQTRNAQIKQQSELREMQKSKQKVQHQQELLQAQQSMADYQKQNMAVRHRNLEFNRSICEDIKNKREQASLNHHFKIQKELTEMKLVDKDIQSTVAKEMAFMEKRKEQRRMIALQAMKMAEERRLREKMQSDVEDRAIQMYNDGKIKIEKKKIEKDKARRSYIFSFREKLAEAQFAHSTPVTKAKAPCMEDVSIKMEQDEKLKKEKSAKELQLRANMEQLQIREQAKKQMEGDQLKFDMANRFKNNEINQQFDQMMRYSKDKKTTEYRNQLVQQMKENEQKKAAEAADNEYYDKSDHIQEDKYFSNFARDLIMDAIKKGRPLQPIFTLVKNYEKDNNIHVYPPKNDFKSFGEPEKTSASPGSPGDVKKLIQYSPLELKKMNPYYSLQ